METIILKDGYTVEVDPDALDDAELFETLIAMDKGESADLPGVLTALLGTEGKKALYEHLRDEKGRVRMTKIAEVVNEIFGEMQAKKKQ